MTTSTRTCGVVVGDLGEDAQALHRRVVERVANVGSLQRDHPCGPVRERDVLDVHEIGHGATPSARTMSRSSTFLTLPDGVVGSSVTSRSISGSL